MKFTMLARLLEVVTGRVVKVEKALAAWPTREELVAEVAAQVPVPKDGVSPDVDAIVLDVMSQIVIPDVKDGVSPDPKAIADEVLARIVVPQAPAPDVETIARALVKAVPQMKDGKKGDKGDRGPVGPMPKHKWTGTKLAFEKPEGGFGPAVDLRGPAGKGGSGGVIVTQTGEGGGGAGIDDSVTAADKTWSSEKIQAELDLLAPEGGAVTSVNGRGSAVTLTAADVDLGAFEGLTPDSLPMSGETTLAVADLQGQIDAIPDAPVTSVNSRTGAVVVTAADVGLSAFTGLTPATLPVSTATAGEIDGAVVEANLYTDAKVAALVDSSPGTLDTLNELAAALGDDPNFATTVAANIASKEPAITSGLVAEYWSGVKTWRDLATDVRAVVLTGLSTASATAVAATDSVLVAFGKLQAQVTALLAIGPQPGDFKQAMRASAPTGWITASGVTTIGNVGSGATRANVDTLALFTLWWTDFNNTQCPILTSTGTASTRGASAAADWAALKRLTVFDMSDRVARVPGTNQATAAKVEDAIQNIIGTFSAYSFSTDLTGQAFDAFRGTNGGTDQLTLGSGTVGTRYVAFNFDASRMVRTSNVETRVKSLGVPGFWKL